jgi:hypothetical protein
LNVFDVLALLDHQAGVGMPQVMEPYLFDSRSLQRRHEISTDHVAVIERLAGFVRKHQIKLTMRTGEPPFFEFGHHGRAKVNSAIGGLGLGFVPLKVVWSKLEKMDTKVYDKLQTEVSEWKRSHTANTPS